jgi:hypothetical protein
MKNIDTVGSFLESISRLNLENLSLFADDFTEIALRKHEYFVREGEISHEVGFLVQGIVRSFL